MSLHAIIMAGGEGTRLRPLTSDTPKPMVPILGKPVLSYALQLLKRHQMTEIGVTLQYLPERISRAFGSGAKEGVHLHYFREHEPLGTAGGVLKAASGRQAPTDAFAVLSGDGLTDCDLTEAMRFHREKKALATLVLTRVRDPLSYGVVMADDEGRVRRFVEKPGWGEVYSDTINTGIYLLSPEVLSYIWSDKPCDFGKDLFPMLVKAEKPVYAFVSDCYWCDIGDQAAYVRSQSDFLLGKVNLSAGAFVAETAQIDPTAKIDGPVYLGAGARVGAHAQLSECAVIGMNASVGAHARVARSVVWEDAVIGNTAQLRGAVIGRGAQVGAGASAMEESALGDGAVLGARAVLDQGAKVWPGKRIDPCMRIKENLVWDGAARPAISAGQVEASDPAAACLLAAAWGEASEAECVALAHDGSPEGVALCHVAAGSLVSQGRRVSMLGQAALPVLRTAQRLLKIDAGIYIEQKKLTLTDKLGGIPGRATQRKVESLVVRQDYPRPFSRRVVRPETVQDAEAMYVATLAASVQMGTSDDVRPQIAVFVKTQYQAGLVVRVLRALGIRGRVSLDEPSIESWETGFILSADSETVSAFDSHGAPDEARQPLLAYAALDGGEWIARMDATASLEALAEARGAAVKRVSAAREAWADALIKADIRQFDLMFDGIYRMLMITSLLTRAKTTLRGLLSQLPAIYQYQERIECALPDRGRLLRLLAEAETKAELSGGLRVARPKGYITVNPDEREAEMVIVGEAANMEAAKELCGELMDRLRKAMAKE